VLLWSPNPSGPLKQSGEGAGDGTTPTPPDSRDGSTPRLCGGQNAAIGSGGGGGT
jgi:hypothetical protein